MVTVNPGWKRAQHYPAERQEKTTEKETVKNWGPGERESMPGLPKEESGTLAAHPKIRQTAESLTSIPTKCFTVRSFGYKELGTRDRYGTPLNYINSREWVYIIQFTLKIWRFTIN